MRKPNTLGMPDLVETLTRLQMEIINRRLPEMKLKIRQTLADRMVSGAHSMDLREKSYVRRLQ
jgi:hypothetical protein